MVLRYDKILKFQFFIIIKFAKSLFYFSATIVCFISRWTIVSLPAQAALPALVLMSQRMRKKKADSACGQRWFRQYYKVKGVGE